MSYYEKIYEGKYLYLSNGTQFCEEDFNLQKEESKKNPNYVFNTEILSRVSSGEFLKIKVKYETNSNFEPLNVTVMRFLGQHKSSELYKLDQRTKIIQYSFRDKNGEVHEIEKPINGKIQITTPSILTSMLMTLTKKIDPVARTTYNVITSKNIFEYESPLQETNVYIELMSAEPVPVKIHRQDLTSTLCHVFQHDKSSDHKEKGVAFYLSKHFAIPYLVKPQDGIEIKIDKLTSTSGKYDNIFKK